MTDENTNESESSEPQKNTFWPDSLQDSSKKASEPLPNREKFYKIFGNALVATEKLAGQTIIFWVLFTFLAVLIINPKLWGSDQNYLVVAELVKLTTFTVSVFLAMKVFDNEDIINLGLKRNKMATQDYLAGIGISFAFFAAKFLLLLGAGSTSIDTFSWETNSLFYVFQNLIVTFMIFVFVGWSEEILSRGYHLRITSKGTNRFFGVLLSSGIFTYLHIGNPGITPIHLFIVFLFGLLASFAFFSTGQLWLAMGLHTGWDYFSAVIFGSSPLDGLNIFHLMKLKYYIYPISYSIIDIFGICAVAVMVYYYTRNKKPDTIEW